MDIPENYQDYLFRHSDGQLVTSRMPQLTGLENVDSFVDFLVDKDRITINQDEYDSNQNETQEFYTNIGKLLVRHEIPLPKDVRYYSRYRDYWAHADLGLIAASASWVAITGRPYLPHRTMTLSRQTLRRASTLGLFGSMKKLHKNEGGIGDLMDVYVAAGISPTEVNRRWQKYTDEELLKMLFSLYVNSDTQPTWDEHVKMCQKSGTIPHPKIYVERFGSWSIAVRESKLLPSKDWSNRDEQDFINWGADFSEANDGLLISERLLSYFRDKEKYGVLSGPPLTTTARKFTSFSNFQNHVVREYLSRLAAKKAEVIRLRDEIQLLINSGELSVDLFRGAGDPKEILARFSKYKLADHFLPQSSQSARYRAATRSKNMQDLLDEITNYTSRISIEDLEQTAIDLGVSTYLWPDEKPQLDVLRLPQSVLDERQLVYIDSAGLETNEAYGGTHGQKGHQRITQIDGGQFHRTLFESPHHDDSCENKTQPHPEC